MEVTFDIYELLKWVASYTSGKVLDYRYNLSHS